MVIKLTCVYDRMLIRKYIFRLYNRIIELFITITRFKRLLIAIRTYGKKKILSIMLKCLHYLNCKKQSVFNISSLCSLWIIYYGLFIFSIFIILSILLHKLYYLLCCFSKFSMSLKICLVFVVLSVSNCSSSFCHELFAFSCNRYYVC